MSVRCPALLFLLVAAAATAAPPRVTEALSRLGSESPRGWAYTLRVVRGAESSGERFDPSRPAGAQWTLLARNGRPATAEERVRHLRHRATTAPGLPPPTFQRGDLDAGSLECVGTEAGAEIWRARFRSDAGSPLLAHCAVDLHVPREGPAFVARTVLRSVAPFSPALGVRLHELEFSVDYLPPTAGRPALPAATRSRVRGRVLFLLPLEEDVATTYSDHALVGERR